MKPQCTPVWGSCTLESGHEGQHSQNGPYAKKVAALYVATNGCYFGLPDVDPWDEPRDARKYNGPHPVVCHSPCPRWGRFARGGPSAKVPRVVGDDGGMFAHALSCVYRFGGVLEHPEASKAWAAFGLVRPPMGGGWVMDILSVDGGGPRFAWTCCVSQFWYGHPARKASWLLYCGDAPPPPLRWGMPPPHMTRRLDEGFHSKEERRAARAAGVKPRRRLSTAENLATPLAFRDLLLSIARSARRAD